VTLVRILDFQRVRTEVIFCLVLTKPAVFRILAIFKQCLVTLVATLSNSKAKLLSSAVSSQLIFPSLLLIHGRDKIKIKIKIKIKMEIDSLKKR
jgi:hypothetical protein